MTTTVNLRKLLDRKQWEMCAPHPVSTGVVAGVGMYPAVPVASLQSDLTTVLRTTAPQRALSVTSATPDLYNAAEDAFIRLTASGIGGAMSTASTAAYHPNGPTGTASAGSSTTLTTTTTVVGDISGHIVRITGGTGAGQEAVITSHTQGANAVLTFAAMSTPPDNTSTYVLLTGRWYMLFPGATPGLRYYDYATNVWSAALVVTGLTYNPTEGVMQATPGSFGQMASGTATSATATTLVNSGKAWTASQWINFQVRIIAGLGAGQVRTITANTTTALTVATWSTTPDATSKYVIEGNDDFLYVISSTAVTMYRYSISGNTWSTLSPGAARAGAPSTGETFDWIYGSTHPTFNTENSNKNGQRIYSFRGGNANIVDYYDIAANTWVSGVSHRFNGLTYSPTYAGFTSGIHGCYDGGDYLYFCMTQTLNQPAVYIRVNPATMEIDPWSVRVYPESSPAGVGVRRTWYHSFRDGATVVGFVYSIRTGSTEIFRQMVI